MVLILTLIITFFLCSPAPGSSGNAGPPNVVKVEAIHKNHVFADMHSHPDRFHRSNVFQLSREEIERYKRGLMDVVACCVSSDAPYHGGYTKKDSTEVERLRPGVYYSPEPGETFQFTLDRLAIIHDTARDPDVVLALSPEDVLDAKSKGQLSLVAALEGADGLEGRLENLRELHARGLRLLQLVHFRANDLGGSQNRPDEPGGLTKFGKDVVRECNRLGIIIDLAHADKQTLTDVLAVSTRPVVCSHTGAKALRSSDRHLSDEEIRAIAAGGGVIGVWPPSGFRTIDEFFRHVDYVKELVGADHVGIGSDLRGTKTIPEFGEEANFQVFAEVMLARGYTDEEVGKIMGGNFFRVWKEVAQGLPEN